MLAVSKNAQKKAAAADRPARQKYSYKSRCVNLHPPHTNQHIEVIKGHPDCCARHGHVCSAAKGRDATPCTKRLYCPDEACTNLKSMMKTFVKASYLRGPGVDRRSPCPKVTRYVCQTYIKDEAGPGLGCGAVWAAWQFVSDTDTVVSVMVRKETVHDHDWPQFLIDSQNLLAHRDLVHLWNLEDYGPHVVVNKEFKLLYVQHLPKAYHPSRHVDLSNRGQALRATIRRGIKRGASPPPIYRPAKVPRAPGRYELVRMQPLPSDSTDNGVCGPDDSLAVHVPPPSPALDQPSLAELPSVQEVPLNGVAGPSGLSQHLAAALVQLPSLQRLAAERDGPQVPAYF